MWKLSSIWARSSLPSVSVVSWLPIAGKTGTRRDHVAVGLEEAGVPVVVLAAALVVHAALLAQVDVVAEARPRTGRRRRRRGGPGPRRRAAAGGWTRSRSGCRRRSRRAPTNVRAASRLGVRAGPEAEVVGAAGGRRGRSRRAASRHPVPALAGGPLLAVDQDAVAVLGVGRRGPRPTPRRARWSSRSATTSPAASRTWTSGAVRLGAGADAAAPSDRPLAALVVDDLATAVDPSRAKQKAPQAMSARSWVTSTRCRNGSRWTSGVAMARSCRRTQSTTVELGTTAP